MGKKLRYTPRRRQRAYRNKWSTFGWLPVALIVALASGYYAADSIEPASRTIDTAPRLAATSALGTSSALVGRASVIDGDTIEIQGERIRLNGVDAPESDQVCKDGNGKSYRCGARAADALTSFLKASSPTTCDFIERDQYGRFVGNCYRADGASVQAFLVGNGWAMDWPRYSGGAYSEEQAAAKAERLGMWVGAFQPPWEWRAGKRQGAQSAPITPLMENGLTRDCAIKGNIASDGDRIYHMPGQQHYSRTKINESKGERWFCSEAEARAAGWRPARR